MRGQERRWIIGLVAGLMLASGAAISPAQTVTKPNPDKPAIYDEKADTKALVEAAVAKAARDHSRVLVMFGGNWCGWCHKLHTVFKTEPKVRQALSGEYELVMLDIAAPGAEALMDEWKVERDKGVPYLIVLDERGVLVTRQDTGSLEEGDHHDPLKVAAFLQKHKAEPVEAAAQLESALARASSEDKRVLLHFGAPWCGWCHRLEDFLARPEIAAVMARDYIDLKIDVDRMTGAKEILARYPDAANSGIPWIVVLDSQGKPIITSESPKGNIGFPVEPHEIEHFVKMLKETARNLTTEQIESIETALQKSAETLKASQSSQ